MLILDLMLECISSIHREGGRNPQKNPTSQIIESDLLPERQICRSKLVHVPYTMNFMAGQ